MNKSLRKALQTATQSARQLLEQEFSEQLEGRFDIRPDGTIPDKAGPHLNAEERVFRQKLVTAIRHKVVGGHSAEEAVRSYLREAAFTTLNRFAALKMLEVRGLVQPCVSGVEDSSGFKEFTMLAPGLSALPDGGYRLYLESLFDEIGQEVNVLFDRQDVAGRLWPRRQALRELLDILNHQKLADAWTDAEAIGWVYQYFNSKDERQEMRSESSTPRNSHELAVRNQFFTPHYVVQFLTDNSLGRTWCEMYEGETRLVETCDYLVQHPNEVFLAEDETPPEDNTSGENVEDEPTYVLHRPKKDPRALRVLDPACGSGHFLLYAFDLLWTIYEEAWMDPDAPSFEGRGHALREDYDTQDELHRALPGLILEHNLYGVDIDPRATQIAAFALWMRAQEAFNDIELARGDRPPVTKTNVVVAEPMPGDKELRQEFTQSLQPPALGQLVDVVFDQMELAGEAGTLLRIEEVIRAAIKKAKGQWQKPNQLELLPEETRKEFRQSGLFDVSTISDTEFWASVEEQIYRALEDYAERGEQQEGLRRQLFADDAAAGFAFVDLCRQRYDVVLMNPPFGSSTAELKSYLKSTFPATYRNLAVAFVERVMALLSPNGFYGAIVDVATSVRSSYSKYRNEVLYGKSQLVSYCDLGWGVLDANVETCCFVGRAKTEKDSNSPIACFNVVSEGDKGGTLRNAISDLRNDRNHAKLYSAYQSEFERFPNAVPNFALPSALRRVFLQSQSLDPSLADVRTGLSSGDNERFYKLRWEISPVDLGEKRWRYLSNGGSFAPFYRTWRSVINWTKDGAEIKNLRTKSGRLKSRPQNLDYNYLPGITYGKRGKYLSVQAHPAERLFTNEGQGIFPHNNVPFELVLALVNSQMHRVLINEYCGQHKENGYVSLLPVKLFSSGYSDPLVNAAKQAITLIRSVKRAEIEHAESYGTGFLDRDTSPRHSLIFLLDDNETRRFTAAERLDEIEQEINNIISRAYKLDDESEQYLTKHSDGMPPLGSLVRPGENFQSVLASSFVDYALGCTFGRWDVRFATGEKSFPALPGPFEPLPTCPPGMLTGKDGLPVIDIPDGYPLQDVPSDGILVDDPGHDRDFLQRIRAVLELAFEDGAISEREACELLGESDLRSYFRKTTGFFRDHRKRYTKSRRKAPIYWQLAPSSTDYSVWLYYPKVNQDTFYRILDVVKEKVRHEERRLADLRQEPGGTPSSSQRSDIADQEDFISELRGFQKEVERVAPLWNPNMNDGVVINYAPLWRLVQHNRSWQKECKKHWDRLVNGEYDWSHWAMHLWPERVVPKCAERRDLAIAHDLEELFWKKNPDGDWVAREEPARPIKEIIQERTSRTVKAALKDIMNAPAPR